MGEEALVFYGSRFTFFDISVGGRAFLSKLVYAEKLVPSLSHQALG